MTLEPWKDNTFLVRFEHIMEKDEDPTLSLPVTFNLTEVFGLKYDFSETNLAGNQWIDDMDRLQFKKVGGSLKTLKEVKTPASKLQKVLSSDVITLKPMQIRTFVMGNPQESMETDGLRSKVRKLLFSYFS